MKRSLLVLAVLLTCASAASASVEMTVEYVTPTPEPVRDVVQSGEFSGMSRSDLIALQTRVEAAIKSLDSSSVNLVDLGMWELNYYVDDFKMPTDNAYVCNTNYIKGTFSNSATDNSKLNVIFLIDKNKLTFMLYEYGRNQVKNSYSSKDEDYDVYVLDSSGVKHSFFGYIPPNGDRIRIEKDAYGIRENEADLLELLKQGGTLRFYVEQSDRRTTNYNFVIDDASGFSTAYEQLFIK